MIVCGSEKYRYFLSVDGGTNYVEVKPVKRPKLKYSKQKGSYDFRISCEAIKLVYHENPGIWSALVSRIENYSTQIQKIKFKIELWDNFTAMTSIPYIGYVTLSTVKQNLDTGTIEFTPTEDDKYGWYEKNKSIKYDLVGYALPSFVNPQNEIKYNITTVTEEYYIPSDIIHSSPHGFSTSCPGLTLKNWSIGKDYKAGNWQYDNWVRNTGWHGNRPYYCIADHVSAPDNEPGVGANWTEYWEEYTLTRYVARQICDLPFNSGVNEYLHGNDTYEEGFPAVITPDPSVSNCDSSTYYYPTCTPESGTMTLVADGTLKVDKVIDSMLTGSGLTFHSSFFSDATNPVTGTTNHLTNLLLCHKAYLKKINDISTKGEVSLNELVEDLCNTFNCYYHIDEVNGYFVIEHQNYYENGFQYTGSPSIGIDLTDNTTYPYVIFDREGGVDDRQSDYLSEELPEVEIFSYLDAYDYDGLISYSSAFVKQGEEKKHQLNIYSLDWAYLVKYPGKTSDEGYCLIACDSSLEIIRRDVWVRCSENHGYYNLTNYPNGDLLFNNLLNDFWKYYRPFTVGKINYFDKIFTRKRIKKQRSLNFQRMGDFNPIDLVKTNMGDGQVSTAELETDTDFLKVTLLY